VLIQATEGILRSMPILSIKASDKLTADLQAEIIKDNQNIVCGSLISPKLNMLPWKNI